MMAAVSSEAEELAVLRQQVRETQIEIAALRHPLADHDRLVAAGEELAAIIRATESATHDVLSAAEVIESAVEAIGSQTSDPAVAERIGDVLAAVVRIFEAANFQDITGQRINKVVRTLDFIEARVSAMTQVWGPEAFENLPQPEEVTENDEAKLLNGPQLEGKAISQADIDALFD